MIVGGEHAFLYESRDNAPRLALAREDHSVGIAPWKFTSVRYRFENAAGPRR